MEKILRENDYFKSPDICLCATLCCYGYQVEAIDKQNPAKVVFLVERNEELDKLIRQYFVHKLRVEPLSFFNYLKELKTRIYNI